MRSFPPASKPARRTSTSTACSSTLFTASNFRQRARSGRRPTSRRPSLLSPPTSRGPSFILKDKGVCRMSRRTMLLAVALGLAVLGAEAADKVTASQPGVVLALEKKSRSRTQYYVVNTPVGVEEPYFEAEIDSAGLVYTVEYEPKSSREVIPDGCLAGQAVKVRVDHRHLFVQCLDSDAEMRWEIQKKKPSAPDSEAPKKH